jgi:hypothetical protein
MGWFLPPHRYRDAVVTAKRDADLGNAVLPQLVLARLMESGELKRQLRLVRRPLVNGRWANLRDDGFTSKRSMSSLILGPPVVHGL